MAKPKQCVSSDEATKASKQHVKPCSDCPWRRTSLNGWLGGSTIGDWIQVAHSDRRIACHVIENQQCAGAAIYRANVGKLPRGRTIIVLKKDMNAVFATPAEFAEHHNNPPDIIGDDCDGNDDLD